MDISVKLNETLLNHLEVKDKFLCELMSETVELCHCPGGPEQAIMKLETKRRIFSSEIDLLEKAPFIWLFMAYARFQQNKRYLALKWTKVAIDGLDQLNQVWNRSIARWICALICQQSHQPEDAEAFFDAAIKLMKQEIHDLKRRSLYDKATECEFVLERLLKDAGLLQENVSVHSTDEARGMSGIAPSLSEEKAGDLF